MYVAIIGPKKVMCLLDAKGRFSKVYFSVCRKEYNMYTHTLTSFDQTTEMMCPLCVKYSSDLHGTPRSPFFHNNTQQSLIVAQDENRNFLNKGKRKLDIFKCTLSRIIRSLNGR